MRVFPRSIESEKRTFRREMGGHWGHRRDDVLRKHIHLIFITVLSLSWATIYAVGQPLPVPAVTINQDPPGARQVEPALAISPLSPTRVVALAEESFDRDSTTTEVRVWVSDDAGQTWRTTGLLPGKTNPSVSYCADGVVWASAGFRVYRSNDDGETWTEGTSPLSGGGPRDLPQLICDDSEGPFSGRLYFSYGSAGQLFVNYSADQAATWTTPVRVDAGGFPTSNYPGDLAIGPQSEVWLAFIKNVSPLDIRTVMSRDGGDSFGPPSPVGPVSLVPGSPVVDYRRTSRPTLAIDRSGGVFSGGAHLVYSTWDGSESDLRYSRHLPGPGNWSPPVRLNDDPIGNIKDQDFPRVSVDPRGLLRVIWLDHRNDPGDGSIEVWAKISRDAGSSFEADFPISTRAFLAPQGEGAFMGDTIAVRSWRDVFIGAWPDRVRDDGDILSAAVRDHELSDIESVMVTGKESTRVSWTSQDALYGAETVYDVVSGRLTELRDDFGFRLSECAAENLPDTPFDDTRTTPTAGDGFYYLIRSELDPQRGSFGAAPTTPDRRLALDIDAPCVD